MYQQFYLNASVPNTLTFVLPICLDGILSKNQGYELEKRIIKEEFLTNWFRKKQLEEEVMIELFGKEMFNTVRDSFLQSNNPKETEETSNKPLTDLYKARNQII